MKKDAAMYWCPLAATAILGCLLAGGCAERGPEGLGAIEQVEDPGEEGAPQPPAAVAQRVNSTRNEHPGLKVSYSRNARSALLHPEGTGGGQVSLWLVTESGQERSDLDMAPDLALYAWWSPDGGRALLCGQGGDPSKELVLACLSPSEHGRAEASVVRGPPGSAHWYIGTSSTDGREVFAMALLDTPSGRWRGQFWAIETQSGKCSLLYTEPPVRLPRGYEGLAYSKSSLRSMALSPSGELLAFDSYAEDNYMGQGVRLLNLRTKKARLVTWERRRLSYMHVPLKWTQDDRCLVFLRAPSQCYELTLAADLWEERPQGSSD